MTIIKATVRLTAKALALQDIKAAKERCYINKEREVLSIGEHIHVITTNINPKLLITA